MAKKSVIERQKKRVNLVNKYSLRRRSLKEKILSAKDFEEKITYYFELQKLPRNSSPSRLFRFSKVDFS